MRENRKYRCLNSVEYNFKNYKIISIKFEHRYRIMKWRNDQIYHLRQNNRLNKKHQDIYFKDVVSKQLNEKTPEQILFSFYDHNNFVAYGGLVHVNWPDKNAEISFVINTKLEANKFKEYWNNFLKIIEIVAFKELGFKKLFIYSYNLRPILYEVTFENNYKQEAHLIQHKFFDGKYIDIYVHSKINHT